MAYTPYYPGGWQSGEQGGTPITPAALNNMENGIATATIKQATITVQGTTAGLIPFTGIAPTNIVSATSNGYVIMPFKINTGAWRGLITDQALNIVTSQPTISVNVLYY